MPKTSKSTAPSHMVIPGYTDTYEQEVGDWTVTMSNMFVDLDETPFFKGAPNDRCQAQPRGSRAEGQVRDSQGRRVGGDLRGR